MRMAASPTGLSSLPALTLSFDAADLEDNALNFLLMLLEIFFIHGLLFLLLLLLLLLIFLKLFDILAQFLLLFFFFFKYSLPNGFRKKFIFLSWVIRVNAGMADYNSSP